MKRILPFLIILSLLLTACANKLMTKVRHSTAPVLDENTACITFYRPSSMGSMLVGFSVKAPIAETEKNDLKIVGIIAYKTKLRYFLPKGKHEFVVGGKKGGILNAELAPKKFYYVCVDPYLGGVKTSFDLLAIKPNKLREEKEKIKKCLLVVPKDKERVEDWLEDHKPSMMAKLQKGRDAYAEATPVEKAKYTLLPSDGVDVLY